MSSSSSAGAAAYETTDFPGCASLPNLDLSARCPHLLQHGARISEPSSAVTLSEILFSLPSVFGSVCASLKFQRLWD